MKKFYSIILGLSMVAPAAAQQKFEQGKPNKESYRYLDNYDHLKNYVDRAKYPTFRVALATIVSDYKNNTTWRNLINKNANETVAGNAMKMASCVDGNGNMNFSTVTDFVNTATNNGVEVYGHTLAWHSQQPNGWLRKLLQDKPAPELTDGDVTVYVPVYSKDFRTQQNVGWKSDESQYGYKLSFDATDGLKIHCTKNQASYVVQFLACTDIVMEKGKTYKMTMEVKGTKAGKLHTKLGDWNGGHGSDISFGTTWKEVTFNYKPTMESNFYLLQCGDFVGDIYIRNIKFESQKKGRTTTEERRCLKVEATAKKEQVWDNQMWFVPSASFAKGASFEFTADVRADKPASVSTQIHNDPSSYVSSNALGNIAFTTDWKTIKLTGSFDAAGKSIALNLNELADANNYYFDNVSLKVNGSEKLINGNFEGESVVSYKVKQYGGGIEAPTISDKITYVYVPSTVPLTEQERHDTLVYAMDKWISGMMKACNGKVKAWDLVNEAISGGGNDGQGNYELQHSEGYKSGTWDVGGDAFYWQDYMGDLEYVRQACRLARKYGPADVKLFINDYNLESTWDGNKKLKSLINWIKKWEADGVTKIDGIGTQMHISYFIDATSQNNQKKAITEMFKLMANSGKMVRVSELDMGICDKQWGTTLKTSEVTEEQEKKMAEYYEWIIKEYLRIIPVKQQWGICQWCPTDAPANSGWRGGEPVGIWDGSYYRKHVYAGWARGLSGQTATDIYQFEAPKTSMAKTGIYDIHGRRYADGTDISTLPSGLYIVNGKKVLKK